VTHTTEPTKKAHCPTCGKETAVFKDGICSMCLMHNGSAFNKKPRKAGKQKELF